MVTVILISSVAILVAIVGCFVIWRMDAARAEEVDHPTPRPAPRHQLDTTPAPTASRSLD